MRLSHPPNCFRTHPISLLSAWGEDVQFSSGYSNTSVHLPHQILRISRYQRQHDGGCRDWVIFVFGLYVSIWALYVTWLCVTFYKRGEVCKYLRAGIKVSSPILEIMMVNWSRRFPLCSSTSLIILKRVGWWQSLEGLRDFYPCFAYRDFFFYVPCQDIDGHGPPLFFLALINSVSPKQFSAIYLLKKILCASSWRINTHTKDGPETKIQFFFLNKNI